MSIYILYVLTYILIFFKQPLGGMEAQSASEQRRVSNPDLSHTTSFFFDGADSTKHTARRGVNEESCNSQQPSIALLQRVQTRATTDKQELPPPQLTASSSVFTVPHSRASALVLRSSSSAALARSSSRRRSRRVSASKLSRSA